MGSAPGVGSVLSRWSGHSWRRRLSEGPAVAGPGPGGNGDPNCAGVHCSSATWPKVTRLAVLGVEGSLDSRVQGSEGQVLEPDRLGHGPNLQPWSFLHSLPQFPCLTVKWE